MERWNGWLKTILAAVIGGLIATGGNWGVGWQLQKSEREALRESVKAGLRGEISVLAENQRHIHFLEGILSELKKDVVLEPLGIPVEPGIVIYEANALNIGLLGPCLIEPVARFYQMVNWSARNEANLTGGTFQALEDEDKKVWLEGYIASEKNLRETGIQVVQQFGRGCE